MLKGLVPSLGNITGRIAQGLLTCAEGTIMLPIAIGLDLIGILLFVLSLLGIGIPISWLLDITGTLIFGGWIISRSIFRGLTKKVTEKATEGLEILTPKLAPKERIQETPGIKVIKTTIKAAKTGVKGGLGIVRFIIANLIELIPFIGDIVPSWTLLVIFELIQGEL